MEGQYRLIKLVLLLLLTPYVIFSQINKPDTIYAFRTSEKINIDGKLDEKSWAQAVPVTNFRQREMEEGALPSEPTKVAILYDQNNLYIGFWGYDSSPDKLVAKQMKRDFNWDGEDNFEFILGTYNDSRNGFLFVINPNGARADALIGNEGMQFIKDWNGVWDVKTMVNDSGWFAEIVVPFSTLSFQKAKIQNWQINFERNIKRKNEQLLWQGYLRQYELEKISRAGTLAGLKDIRSQTLFEFKPYVTVGVEKTSDVPLDKIVKTGGEINSNITPTMKLNVTVNTDFAQVEADDAKVNLSRFNLYYKEKRQFFLEGSNYFDFKTGHRNLLYYSRRIGLENRTVVPIYGGVRLFGKAGKNNIGLMSMQTGNVDAKYTYDSTAIQSTNYSVLRYRRDLMENSNAGFIITSKIRKDGRKNLVYGGDFNYRNSNFLGNSNLGFGMTLAKSFTDGMDNSRSLAYNTYVYYGTNIIRAISSFTGVQENYNPELGFVRRENYKSFFSTLVYKPRFKSLKNIRNFEFVPYEFVAYLDDKTNELQSLWYEIEPLGVVLKSGDNIFVKYQRTYENIDYEFEIFNNVKVPVGEYWNNGYEFGFETFKGRKLSTEFQVNYEGFYNGTRLRTELNLDLNANKHLNFNLNWNRHFIEFPQTAFTVHEFGSKMEYAFNPKLNTSIFTQWNNKDEEVILNYRINWIPKIGSDFYFVINQLIDKTTGEYKLKTTTVLLKFVWRFTA